MPLQINKANSVVCITLQMDCNSTKQYYVRFDLIEALGIVSL